MSEMIEQLVEDMADHKYLDSKYFITRMLDILDAQNENIKKLRRRARLLENDVKELKSEMEAREKSEEILIQAIDTIERHVY